jgi:predicted Ser/Thr protein kinase
LHLSAFVSVPQTHRAIQQHLLRIFDELMQHDGYGEFKVELRLLKRGQKEVLLHYGKQYRYVIDFDAAAVHMLPAQAPQRLLSEPE